MTSSILDELEMWIKRARLRADSSERPITHEEATAYQAHCGPHELILGPFVIRREQLPEGDK